MISGLVPFESILESVKDGTGIENLRPYYERVRRLIFRAERSIGYGGSVILKKYTTPAPAGLWIPFPPDLIEVEGVGRCCFPIPSCEYSFKPEGIRFKKAQTEKIVLLYWAICCDGYGNPIVTRNHEEAVVAFIVYHLYKSKMFLGNGNMNMYKELQQEHIMEIGSARGEDAMPTLEQWNELGQLSYSDRRALLQQPTASYNYCAEDILEACLPVTDTTMKVYYWQISGAGNITNESPLINANYLASKPNNEFVVFEQGKIVDYTLIGRICFAITPTDMLPQNFAISDSLNNDVTDEFDSIYIPEINAILFVSKNPYSYSSIYFKFKEIQYSTPSIPTPQDPGPGDGDGGDGGNDGGDDNPPPTPLLPVFTSPSSFIATPLGINLAPVTLQLSADNSPTSFALVSAPQYWNVTVDSVTGLLTLSNINGDPEGDYSIIVSATNADGTTNQTITVNVLNLQLPYISMSDTAQVIAGYPFSLVVYVNQLNDPILYPITITVENLPDGLSFDPITNTISGTPTTGVLGFTIIATNVAGTVTKTITEEVLDGNPPSDPVISFSSYSGTDGFNMHMNDDIISDVPIERTEVYRDGVYYNYISGSPLVWLIQLQAPGSTHLWKVRLKDAQGLFSGFSNEISVTIPT